MKITIETDDKKELKRIAKSEDMALFIWQLVHNGWRRFKNTDYDYERSWEVIDELLAEYRIDPDDFIE